MLSFSFVMFSEKNNLAFKKGGHFLEIMVKLFWCNQNCERKVFFYEISKKNFHTSSASKRTVTASIANPPCVHISLSLKEQSIAL